MASIKLDLNDTTWENLGSSGVVVVTEKVVRIVNADSIPTGAQEASFVVDTLVPFLIPAPASGNLFVLGKGSIKYYEV